jgi:hypothetical protein
MSEEPVLRFRNYVPRDAALAQHVVAPVLPAAPAAAAAGGDAAPLPEPDAPVLLVPKRANWDLKRDIAPKLESLERMTQRAIAELVQSKVAAAASAAASGGGGGASSSSGSSSGSGSSSSSADGSAGGAAGGAQQPQGESLDDVYAGPIDTALLSARVAALEAGEGQ